MSSKLLASHNNILTNHNPIVTSASIKSIVDESATIKDVYKEMVTPLPKMPKSIFLDGIHNFADFNDFMKNLIFYV